MQAGQKVVYVDEDGVSHEATVMAVHGDTPGPRVLDLTYSVSDSQSDGAGEARELVSVAHESVAMLDGEAVPPFWRQK